MSYRLGPNIPNVNEWIICIRENGLNDHFISPLQDKIKKTPFTLPPAPATFDFFVLPREIRDEVYKLVANTDQLQANMSAAWTTYIEGIVRISMQKTRIPDHDRAYAFLFNSIERTYIEDTKAHDIFGVVAANKQMRYEFMDAASKLTYFFNHPPPAIPYDIIDRSGITDLPPRRKEGMVHINGLINPQLAVHVGTIQVVLPMAYASRYGERLAPYVWTMTVEGQLLYLPTRKCPWSHCRMLKTIVSWLHCRDCHVKQVQLEVTSGGQKWECYQEVDVEKKEGLLKQAICQCWRDKDYTPLLTAMHSKATAVAIGAKSPHTA